MTAYECKKYATSKLENVHDLLNMFLIRTKDKKQTLEMCDNAVREDPYMVKFVLDQYKHQRCVRKQ